ncbi:hypothetical protein CALCODRAFT_480256 [Calocera cornea HHB12733]|uniref:Uncharacterized protein n=1 Tax=Calocera cornea HHB12733 TaxID=1353952 RepID=A0A165IXQ7_9BASI|nr:hypothetical protein CALCODRAFT_480256 [Calocera cornea HHB12733]
MSPTADEILAMYRQLYESGQSLNAELNKRVTVLEDTQGMLLAAITKKKKKPPTDPDCPASKSDDEMMLKEVKLQKVVRDLMRTQLYDTVGYSPEKDMPGLGREAPPCSDGGKAYMVADWNSSKSSEANLAIIRHAVTRVRQAHLYKNSQMALVCHTNDGSTGPHDFNTPDAVDDEMLEEEVDEPLIDPQYQQTWLSVKNLMYIGAVVWQTMQQIWLNQRDEEKIARTSRWKTKGKRVQRRVTRAERLTEGAKLFARKHAIVNVEGFCAQILKADWVGDLESCDEEGGFSDGWWMRMTTAAGWGPDQVADKRNAIWELKRPAWMKEAIWQLYATFNHLKWVHEERHSKATPYFDLGSLLHAAIEKSSKPWRFMVDDAYLADHPAFEVIEALPDGFTEQMCEELQRLNNRFIDVKFKKFLQILVSFCCRG